MYAAFFEEPQNYKRDPGNNQHSNRKDAVRNLPGNIFIHHLKL